MLLLSIPAAHAASLDEVSKIVTGLTTWEERLDYLSKGVETASEAEQPRWLQVTRIVRMLARNAPDTDRVVLRDLVDAAVGDDEALAAEALKAARLGLALPERVEGSPWMAHHPHIARSGSVLTATVTGDPEAGKRVEAAVSSVATAAQWTIGPDGTAVSIGVAAPRPSVWGPKRGMALRAKVTWPDGSTGEVDGFSPGPLRPDAWDTLASSLVGNVLAHASFDPRERGPASAPALLPDTPPAEVCLARLPDTGDTGLEVSFDQDFVLVLAPGAFQCLTVAAGTVVRGHEGALPAPASTTTWLEVRHGSQFPWSRIETVDAAKAERWREKGKLRPSEAVVTRR